MYESRIDFTELKETVAAVREQIHTIVVGQDSMVNLLLTAILADGHVLLEGVPGVAKTLTAKLLAQTVQTGFSRIQFTPDLMPSDVVGTMVFNPKDADFAFKKGPVFSNIVLVDEINRAPAKTQAALLEVMEERQVSIDGTTHAMPRPFLVIATQNPVEQEGTYRLPEAQLDRFLFKVVIGYPTLQNEIDIIRGHHNRASTSHASTVSSVVSVDQLEVARSRVRNVYVDDKLLGYIAAIVQQTRNNASLYLGASPRASVGILAASKAAAAIEGVDFITPDHIRHIVPHVLRHRIQLTPDREMEGSTPDDIIREIISTTEVPR